MKMKMQKGSSIWYEEKKYHNSSQESPQICTEKYACATGTSKWLRHGSKGKKKLVEFSAFSRIYWNLKCTRPAISCHLLLQHTCRSAMRGLLEGFIVCSRRSKAKDFLHGHINRPWHNMTLRSKEDMQWMQTMQVPKLFSGFCHKQTWHNLACLNVGIRDFVAQPQTSQRSSRCPFA